MMSDQKTSLRQLPYDVLLNILSYLDIHELHSLEVLPELKPLFQTYNMEHLIRQITNMDSSPENNKLVKKISEVWKGQPIIDIPFWGYRSDGGVMYQSIPFWIGKAFMKTDKPVVGLSTVDTGCFSGKLSQDYHEFKNIIQGLSKLFSQVFEDETFQTQISEINLKKVIMRAFHTNIPEADLVQLKRFKELRDRLYQYAMKLHFVLQSHDGLQIDNDEVNELEEMANIHWVQLSRQFSEEMYQNIRNCCQTLVIGVKNPLKAQDLTQVPEIAETNLTKDELAIWNFKWRNPINTTSQMKYIIFKNNDKGILLWVDLGNKLKVELRIPYGARVWTNKVHICMLRGRREKQPMALSISYLAFKGIVIEK